MSSSLPACTALRVRLTSSGLGDGSPLGWLCARMIDAALRSPVIRVRRGALLVLASWLRDSGDAAASQLQGVQGVLERAAAREVDDELAADFAKVLSTS